MVASIFKKTMSALFGLMLISVLNAEIITATYDDEEQVLIKPEDIPVTIPEIIVPTVDVPVVVTPNVDTSIIKIETINVAVPNVYDPNAEVAAFQELVDELKSKIHDKRSIDYDKTIHVGNSAIKKWMTIYSAYSSNAGYVMDYVPPHKGLRMITEARVPKTKEEKAIQLDNLDWYRSKWYNACLLAIYMDEDLDDLINLADTIKEKGYDLYITYSGVETLESTVFKDPDVIKKYLSALAPMSRGFIIGWRKTSVHLFIQDYQFSRYLVECVRNANPKIEVFGEAYYGQTADTDHRTDRLTYNLPKNSTGCILVGVGYRQVNANGVLSGLFGALQQNQKFPVVLGDRAYYKTVRSNGLSFEENFAIKLEIEKKFLRYGAYGIITMHGDGYSEETDCLTSPRN